MPAWIASPDPAVRVPELEAATIAVAGAYSTRTSRILRTADELEGRRPGVANLHAGGSAMASVSGLGTSLRRGECRRSRHCTSRMVASARCARSPGSMKGLRDGGVDGHAHGVEGRRPRFPPPVSGIGEPCELRGAGTFSCRSRRARALRRRPVWLRRGGRDRAAHRPGRSTRRRRGRARPGAWRAVAARRLRRARHFVPAAQLEARVVEIGAKRDGALQRFPDRQAARVGQHGVAITEAGVGDAQFEGALPGSDRASGVAALAARWRRGRLGPSSRCGLLGGEFAEGGLGAGPSSPLARRRSASIGARVERCDDLAIRHVGRGARRARAGEAAP